MKGWKRLLNILVWLVLLLGSGALPAAVEARGQQLSLSAGCEMASHYIYNGSFDEVYIDVANWSTGTRATIFSLAPGQSTRFDLEPGWIEFFVVHWDFNPDRDWQTGAWVSVAGCDQVASYIKNVTDPEFFVRIKPGIQE